MKNFAKMAKAIRNYDEEKGHSVATTCNFIDSEFSDGTGRLSRARSKSSKQKMPNQTMVAIADSPTTDTPLPWYHPDNLKATMTRCHHAYISRVYGKKTPTPRPRHRGLLELETPKSRQSMPTGSDHHGGQVCKVDPPAPPVRTPPRHRVPRRVRLFNNAKSLSNEQKDKKLKREYARMDELSQLIFWTDKGREGAAHIKQKIQQKQIAEKMAATSKNGMTVKEAQKIIAESLEIQKKAKNAARSSAFVASSSSHSGNGSRKRTYQRYGSNKSDDRRRSTSGSKYRGSTAGGGRGKPSFRPRNTNRAYSSKGRKQKSGDRA